MPRFQFSLTWLAIASLVIGAFFGGVATGRRCYELENRQAISAIDKDRQQLDDERMQLWHEKEKVMNELGKRIAEWGAETEAIKNAQPNQEAFNSPR